MNEMELLEARLRSWQPRHPSAKLERRLFAAPANFMPKVAWLLGSMTPATACVLLTFCSLNAGNHGHGLCHEPMMAMVLSNQSYAAYASDNFRGTENNLSAVTFDWTNHSVSPSSMAPF